MDVNRTLWRLTGMGRWQGTVSQIIIIIFCLVVCLRKRYYYYLTNGIRKDMIAPEEDKVMVRISKLISNRLLTNPFLEPLMIDHLSPLMCFSHYSPSSSISQ